VSWLDVVLHDFFATHARQHEWRLISEEGFEPSMLIRRTIFANVDPVDGTTLALTSSPGATASSAGGGWSSQTRRM
jgi:hypothetical protein